MPAGVQVYYQFETTSNTAQPGTSDAILSGALLSSPGLIGNAASFTSSGLAQRE
jgi:hypothetical protein